MANDIFNWKSGNFEGKKHKPHSVDKFVQSLNFNTNKNTIQYAAGYGPSMILK